MLFKSVILQSLLTSITIVLSVILLEHPAGELTMMIGKVKHKILPLTQGTLMSRINAKNLGNLPVTVYLEYLCSSLNALHIPSSVKGNYKTAYVLQ